MIVIEGDFEGDELVTRRGKSALSVHVQERFHVRQSAAGWGLPPTLEGKTSNGKNAPFLTEDCFGTKPPVSRLAASFGNQPVRRSGSSKRFLCPLVPVG